MTQVSFKELAPDVKGLDDLLANYNLFVCGINGSGKSTLVKWMARNSSSANVYINTEDEAVPGERVVGDPDRVIRLLRKGEREINYVFSAGAEDDPRIMKAELAQVVNHLFRLGDVLRGEGQDKTGHWCELYLGEVQDLADKMEKVGPVVKAEKRGRKRGIRIVAESQRPADVNHTVLTQSTYHVIFRLGDYDVPYFTDYRIPIAEFQSWIEKKHHFVIVRGDKWAPFQPIKP